MLMVDRIFEKYATDDQKKIARMNRIKRLMEWSNHKAGLVLAGAVKGSFTHHYHRVNQFQLDIIRLEKEMEGKRY